MHSSLLPPERPDFVQVLGVPENPASLFHWPFLVPSLVPPKSVLRPVGSSGCRIRRRHSSWIPAARELVYTSARPRLPSNMATSASGYILCRLLRGQWWLLRTADGGHGRCGRRGRRWFWEMLDDVGDEKERRVLLLSCRVLGRS